MSSPTIADLPSASVVNDTDQLLVRQPAGGLGVDKKVTAALLRQFNVSAFADLPTNPVVDDLMSVSRATVNYKIRFDQVSFIPGTQMWFYQNTAPSGWTVVGSGDRLLAVKGGTSYPSGGVETDIGMWQQAGAVLTINQIPGHSHQYYFGDSAVSGPKANRPNLNVNAIGGVGTTNFTGGTGSTTTNNPTLQPADAHNHGNTWRPAAAVGVLCKKNDVV